MDEKLGGLCYDFRTVQAGKPMTVKVMGKQALACFPSLLLPTFLPNHVLLFDAPGRGATNRPAR
jgi:hypothetical protein